MKKILFVVLIILVTSDSFAGSRGLRMMDEYVPEPRLVEPVKETLDITGRETVTFRWSSHEQTRGFRSYYDFRLYKGYDLVEPARILKKQVDPNTFYLKLPSSMFEDGILYTWSLRQVYDGGRKSDRSYQSFKVIKR